MKPSKVKEISTPEDSECPEDAEGYKKQCLNVVFIGHVHGRLKQMPLFQSWQALNLSRCSLGMGRNVSVMPFSLLKSNLLASFLKMKLMP